MKTPRLGLRIIASMFTTAMMLTSLSGCAGSPQASSSSTPTPSSSSEKPVVKVGVMCPMSGQSARMGELYKSAIDAALIAVEEDGLLKDYTLEFQYVDDKADTASAVTAANYVIDNYGAHVSIGHMLTTMILVSGQYFEDAQVPLLGIVSGPASVSQGWDYLSIETGTDLQQADTLLKYLIEEKGFSKIGLIHVNTEGGMSAANRIEETLKSTYSLTLSTRDAMTTEDTDFTAQILKMRDAGVESVIFWGLSQAQGNTCMQQIEQLWGPVPEDVFFAGGTNLAQTQMTETWGEKDLVGIVYPVGYIPDNSNPAIERFIKNFKAVDPLNQDPADVPARVYDSVFHIVTALNNMGAQDVNADDFTVNLNKALRTASFDGVQGHFNFSEFDNGVGLGQMNIGEWTEGFGQKKIFP